MLQLHYLIATRQALNKIERPLTKTDLGYIWQLRFERAKDVSRDAVQEFWKWFGKVLHILRHQKPVPELWAKVGRRRELFNKNLNIFFFSGKGFIFGFISKEAAHDLLRGKPIGTFLIRFSEQSAGQFAVACVSKGKKAGETTIKVFLVERCNLFLKIIFFC